MLLFKEALAERRLIPVRKDIKVMKYIELTFFFIFLSMSSQSFAQAYRCKDSSGKINYQQIPCANDQEGKKLNIEAPPQQTADQLRINKSIASGRVTRGMSAAQVRTAWGNPKSINKGVYGKRVSEQWVYDRGKFKSQYVYLEDGIVTSIQTPGTSDNSTSREDLDSVPAISYQKD